MAEYITKEQALETQCEKCPMYNCILRCNSYNAVKNLPSADVVERSKIDKAKTNIEIMLEQEKQKDGTYTDVGKGIAIALGLINNEIGER